MNPHKKQEQLLGDVQTSFEQDHALELPADSTWASTGSETSLGVLRFLENIFAWDFCWPKESLVSWLVDWLAVVFFKMWQGKIHANTQFACFLAKMAKKNIEKTIKHQFSQLFFVVTQVIKWIDAIIYEIKGV